MKENQIVNNNSKVDFSTGVKVWLYICAVSNGVLALVYFLMLSGSNVFPGYGLIVGRGYAVYFFIGAVVMSICFSLIISKKIRAPFYLTVVHTIIVFICNLSMNASVSPFMYILGLSMPVITYFTLKKHWSDMDIFGEYAQIINKALGNDIIKPNISDKKAVINNSVAPTVESLIKRGKLFLEDSEWMQAEEYYDRVLDIDPEYSPAYIGKLCVDYKLFSDDKLYEIDENRLSDNPNYKKALRFAKGDYHSFVVGLCKSKNINHDNTDTVDSESNNDFTDELSPTVICDNCKKETPREGAFCKSCGSKRS